MLYRYIYMGWLMGYIYKYISQKVAYGQFVLV